MIRIKNVEVPKYDYIKLIFFILLALQICFYFFYMNILFFTFSFSLNILISINIIIVRCITGQSPPSSALYNLRPEWLPRQIKRLLG